MHTFAFDTPTQKDTSMYVWYACLSSPLLPGLTSKKMVALYDYNPEEDSPNDPEDRKVIYLSLVLLLLSVVVVVVC